MLFLSDFGLFVLKAAVIAAAITVVAGLIIQMTVSRKARFTQLEVEKLHTRFRRLRSQVQSKLLNKKQAKSLVKSDKKSEKKTAGARDRRVFVLDFNGDIRASQTQQLREEVTAILSVAKEGDEVVVRLESGGGMVTAYGLAASQLERLKRQKIKLTICVDKVAASGGYMMACVADRILAAPFAIVGSIGVIAQVPNFNRLLKKHDVEYREVTAGQYKRTVTLLGEITESGMEKFKEQIEETHVLFKEHVAQCRPQMDINKVSTGEYWYGRQAINLGLVDEILTSDEYLFPLYEEADVLRLSYHGKKSLVDRISESATSAAHSLLTKVWSDLENRKFGS